MIIELYWHGRIKGIYYRKVMITKFRSVGRSQVTESLESQAEHFWSGGGNGVCGEGLDFNRKMWFIKKEMD